MEMQEKGGFKKVSLNNWKWKKSMKGISLSLLSLAVLAGCGSKPTSQNAVATISSEKVIIGYLATPDPEAIAAEEGFFKKEINAQVELKSFDSGPAALAAIASGAIQFMTMLGTPPVANAISKGVPIEVVWAQELYTTGEGLIVKKDSNINSLTDLRGKKVALVKGSNSDLAFSTALKAANMNESDVNEINMSPPNMVAAWKSGNIDASFTWDPAKSAMLKDGGKMLIVDKDIDVPIFNLAVVNSDWAATHKTLVEGFIKAEAAGFDFYKSNPDKSYEDMAKFNEIDVASAKEQTVGFQFLSLQDQFSTNGLGAEGQVEQSLITKSLKMAAELGLKQGQIESTPKSMSKFVNNSYVKSVLNGK